MQRVSLIVAAVVGLLAAAAAVLAVGPFFLPPGGSHQTHDPLSLSVADLDKPYAMPSECLRLANSALAGVSVGPIHVQLTIQPAENVRVEEVDLVVSARQRVLNSRCAKALSSASQKVLRGSDIYLPQHGSIVRLPDNLVNGGTFDLNILPPAKIRPVPTAYIWYIRVLARAVPSPGATAFQRATAQRLGPIVRGSNQFLMLTTSRNR